jgi:hypothetical protein
VRKERVDRERRLEGFAMEVLIALGERVAQSPRLSTRRAGLPAMINDEHVTVPEMGQSCAGS